MLLLVLMGTASNAEKIDRRLFSSKTSYDLRRPYLYQSSEEKKEGILTRTPNTHPLTTEISSPMQLNYVIRHGTR